MATRLSLLRNAFFIRNTFQRSIRSKSQLLHRFELDVALLSSAQKISQNLNYRKITEKYKECPIRLRYDAEESKPFKYLFPDKVESRLKFNWFKSLAARTHWSALQVSWEKDNVQHTPEDLLSRARFVANKVKLPIETYYNEVKNNESISTVNTNMSESELVQRVDPEIIPSLMEVPELKFYHYLALPPHRSIIRTILTTSEFILNTRHYMIFVARVLFQLSRPIIAYCIFGEALKMALALYGSTAFVFGFSFILAAEVLYFFLQAYISWVFLGMFFSSIF